MTVRAADTYANRMRFVLKMNVGNNLSSVNNKRLLIFI